MKNSILKLLGACLIVAAFTLTVIQLQQSQDMQTPPPPTLAGAEIGGDFELVDHNGTIVTQADYAGRYLMFFFGFANCPEICPTELDKLAAVLTQLTPDLQKRIQVLFVTTDPERDTPQAMKEYVEKFHPDIVGLTGSIEQITEMTAKWRVYAQKVDMGNGEYMMNHSAYTYLMNPQMQPLDVFKMEDTVEAISRRVIIRVAADQ